MEWHHLDRYLHADILEFKGQSIWRGAGGKIVIKSDWRYDHHRGRYTNRRYTKIDTLEKK